MRENHNSLSRHFEEGFNYEEYHRSALVGFLTFDSGFIIQKANPAAEKIILGAQKAKSVLGKSFPDFLLPSYQKAFHSYLQKIHKSRKRQDQVFQLQSASGKDIYVILESIPVLNKNEIISIRSIIVDISDQKLSELRRQTELIQAAVEDMLDPFAILIAERDSSDKITDFVYTYVNHAANKANKLSMEETIGKRLLEISPSLRDSSMFNDFIKVVETGRPIMKEGVYMEFTNENQTLEGIFHTRINKLDDGIILTFRDISERIEAEEKFRSAISKLEDSNKELDQFAHIASHDLKEPLRMVTQYTKLLSKRYSGRLDSKADEFISFILEGTSRMLLLLNDLLKYARVTSQAKPLELTDMNLIADEVLMDLKFQILDKRAEITIDLLPSLMADPVQMRQLFQNLIENAIKFCSSGKPIVRISVAQERNEWLFSVKDNGIGINPENSDRIFLLFQRLHGGVKYPGSGIGLALCKKIVESHGGRMWVESEEGKGSTFYFTIPA